MTEPVSSHPFSAPWTDLLATTVQATGTLMPSRFADRPATSAAPITPCQTLARCPLVLHETHSGHTQTSIPWSRVVALH
jgi:hypothetical protein